MTWTTTRSVKQLEASVPLSKQLELYFRLERIMIELDDLDDPFAENIRDMMDHLWYGLSGEDHTFLNTRRRSDMNWKAVWIVTRWFRREWWSYLLEKKNYDTRWLTVILCRIKGHPEGPVWQNVSGLEPDWRCKRCGDDLG